LILIVTYCLNFRFLLLLFRVGSCPVVPDSGGDDLSAVALNDEDAAAAAGCGPVPGVDSGLELGVSASSHLMLLICTVHDIQLHFTRSFYLFIISTYFTIGPHVGLPFPSHRSLSFYPHSLIGRYVSRISGLPWGEYR
jgi:hypothetical protein